MKFYFCRIIALFSLVILSFISGLEAKEKSYDKRHNLAVCMIFKNCTPYLKEWIEYHRLVGVNHFYLFNNSSTDHPETVLQDYIDNRIVTLIDWPNIDEKNWGGEQMAWVRTTQLSAYDRGIRLALNKYKWLAIIDSDEFLVPMNAMTMTEVLARHEEAPAVGLYWVVYGTSNVYDIPPKYLMIELLKMRSPLDYHLNGHPKSIVKPVEYTGWVWPTHLVGCKNGSVLMLPKEETRINHYMNRTLNFFFQNKIGNKEKIDNVHWNNEYIAEVMNTGNDEEDDTMDRFIPQLLEKMGFSDREELTFDDE